MNKSRFFIGLLLVAFVVLFAPASRAQTNCQSAGSTINCNVMAVGSSAIFPSAAIAAVSADPTRGNTALCGTNFWTGSAHGIDPRSANIPHEGGTVWIAWDNSTTPTVICTYLSVDSIVGQRLFFAQGTGTSGPANNGTLLLDSGNPCTTAGANKVAFMWDTATTGLPSAVYNALQGTTGTTCPAAAAPVHFTTASTDVSPADALFVGNQRVLASDGNSSAQFPADSKGGLGFGSANCATPGQAVLSSYSGSSAQSVCYTYVAGQPDPITGTLIPSSTIVSEGALAMIPIINVTNTASGGFGDLFNNRGFNNVLSSSLAAGYAHSAYGTAAVTRDLYTGSGASIPVTPIHYVTREPQSGTYTTWEWQVIRSKESALGGGGLSAETNVCGPSQGAACGYNTPTNNAVACPNQTANLANGTYPATRTCSNYMSWGVNFDALKTRAIGTGELVNVVNLNCATLSPPNPNCNISDAFGYAFWSLGTFGGKNNVRYLQLDGGDALYSGWTSADGGNNGVFPLTIGGATGQGKSATPGPAPANGCAGYFNGNGGTVQSFACNAWLYPTFANVRNGNYRVWSVNRVMWYGTFPNGTAVGNPSWTNLDPPAFWLSAADQTAPVVGSPAHGTIPDFMPFAYCANAAACPDNSVPTLTYPMTAFRSHYAITGAGGWGIGSPNNGVTASGFGGTENGGDVAGVAINVQAEADSINFFGGDSFLSWVQ